MGVLGVSAGKVQAIIDTVKAILLRHGMPNLRNKEGLDWRTTMTVQVSTHYPEVFDMTCIGVQEEKFVRQKAIQAMSWYAVEKEHKAARLSRRMATAALVGNQKDRRSQRSR